MINTIDERICDFDVHFSKEEYKIEMVGANLFLDNFPTKSKVIDILYKAYVRKNKHVDDFLLIKEQNYLSIPYTHIE